MLVTVKLRTKTYQDPHRQQRWPMPL